jgi:tetratricopeptide (TPR) repeat protein
MTARETRGARPLVGLCMIVRNEEAMLPGCLDSVRGAVDEIVVVDTGSTDRTKEIARAAGARLADFAWCDDFSAARNASLDVARAAWILYLDADERLSPGQADGLRALCLMEDADAYLVTITGNHTLAAGSVRHANAYPRLFRNRPGIRFSGRVHEQIAPAIEAQKGRIGRSELTIEHLGYDADLETIRRKCRRNLEILRGQAASGPDRGYTQFQIGNTLTILGEYPDAQKELEAVLETPGVAPSIVGSACNLLTEIAIRRDRIDEARTWALRSLKEVPRQVMAHWFLTAIAVAQGDGREGLMHLDTVVQRGDAKSRTELSYDMTPSAPEIAVRRGDLLGASKRWHEAAEAYAAALAGLPQVPGVADKLAMVMRLTADPVWTLDFLRTHPHAANTSAAMVALHASAHGACGNIESARKVLSAGIDREGPSQALFDAWLALEIDGTHEKEALDVVRQALRRGAESPFLCRLGVQAALRVNDVRTAVTCLERMSILVPTLAGKLRPQIDLLRERLEPALEDSGVPLESLQGAKDV